MPHVLDDRTDPRIEANHQRILPRAIIVYALLCIVAAVFVIGSAVVAN